MTDSELAKAAVRAPKVQFVLMGFDQQAGIRLYAFRGTLDGVVGDFKVGVDLALIPTYGIQIQELPLLCREFLEQRGQDSDTHTLTLTETEMRTLAETRATAKRIALENKKSSRRPHESVAPGTNSGGFNRVSQPVFGR